MPAWAENAVIYEVNVRQFTREGTFAAFEKHLPRLQQLGVTVLWFMPIHPIGKKRRKGSLGSYYSIRDYYGVNPEFGALADFKALVKKIHDMGMYVIIDLVANHTAWDNRLLTEHPAWYMQNDNGEIVAPFAGWEDVADLNYDNADLRRYMADMMLYWIRDIGIDGYRCDVAELVPNDFWQTAIAELQKIKPVLMLAEGQHPSLHAHGFHISYGFNMYWLFDGIAAGKRRVQEIDKLLDIDARFYPHSARRLRFTSNHDQNTWHGSAIERLGDAVYVFAMLTFTLPGTPLIYSGQETGNQKRLPFFEKDEIAWTNSPFEEFYRQLCALYKTHAALFKGDFLKIETDAPDQIYAFQRRFENDRIIVVANLSAMPRQTILNVDQFNSNYVEAFSAAPLSIREASLSFSLNAWDYKIYLEE